MSNEEPERHEPPHGEPAQVRPGPHVTPPKASEPVPLDTEMQILREARHLFRVARHPRSDPLWKYLRPQLEDLCSWMIEKELTGLPLYRELRHWLYGEPM